MTCNVAKAFYQVMHFCWADSSVSVRSNESSSKQGKGRRKWGGLLGSGKPKASHGRPEDIGPRLPLPPTISKETMVWPKTLWLGPYFCPIIIYILSGVFVFRTLVFTEFNLWNFTNLFNSLRIVDVHWTRRSKWTERSSTSTGRDIAHKFLRLECTQIAVFETNHQELPVYTVRMHVDDLSSVLFYYNLQRRFLT